MAIDFDQLLEDVRLEVRGTKGRGRQAVNDIRNAAAAGANLSPIVPALLEVVSQSHNVDILDPIAGALAIHIVAGGDVATLGRALEIPCMPSRLLRGLGEYGGDGRGLAPALPLVIDCLNGSEDLFFPVVDVLQCHLRADLGRLQGVITLMAEKKTPWRLLVKVVARLLDVVAVDMSPAIPILARWMLDTRGNKQEEDLLPLLCNAIRHGTSPDQARQDIDKLLEHENWKVKAHIATALATSLAGRENDPGLEALLGHADEMVRAGAVFGLSANQDQDPPSMKVRLAILTRGLQDVSREVRNTARVCLCRVDRGRWVFPPGEAALRSLAGSLGKAAFPEDLTAYFVAFAEASPDHARMVLDVLAGLPADENGPITHDLGRKVEAILARFTCRPCSICEFLPRNAVYTDGRQLPPEFSRLEYISSSGLSKCPECGSLYASTFSEEWRSAAEGMGVDTEITLRRLHPREALGTLKGDEAEAARREYPGLIADVRRRLDHPKAWIREEAAWILTDQYLEEKRFDEIPPLLETADPRVRVTTLQTALEHVAAGHDISPLLPAVEKSLADPDPAVKAAAEKILAHRPGGK